MNDPRPGRSVLVEHGTHYIKTRPVTGDEVYLSVPGGGAVETMTVTTPSGAVVEPVLRQRSFCGELDTCGVVVAEEWGGYRYRFQVNGRRASGRFLVGNGRR
jgi:hypothetical protein